MKESTNNGSINRGHKENGLLEECGQELEGIFGIAQKLVIKHHDGITRDNVGYRISCMAYMKMLVELIKLKTEFGDNQEIFVPKTGPEKKYLVLPEKLMYLIRIDPKTKFIHLKQYLPDKDLWDELNQALIKEGYEYYYSSKPKTPGHWEPK